MRLQGHTWSGQAHQLTPERIDNLFLDANHVYLQEEIEEDDLIKAAFTSHHGLYLCHASHLVFAMHFILPKDHGRHFVTILMAIHFGIFERHHYPLKNHKPTY